MKKLKRGISMVMALILSVAMMTGCAAKTEEQASAKAPESKGTIVVGVSGEFFPLNFMKDGNLQGYEVDLWNEIGKRTGYKIEYKAAKFAGLFGMLDAGQIDTIAHQVAINPEREEKYAFTESHVKANYQLVVKSDSTLAKLEDFKGKKVGVVAGGMGDKMLQKINEENKLDIKIVGYESPAGMDSDLEMGRLDARLGPAIQTRANIKEKNLAFKVTDVVIFSETAAFPFVKGEKNAKKLEEVSQVIKDMKADGSLSKLSVKWFEVDATK